MHYIYLFLLLLLCSCQSESPEQLLNRAQQQIEATSAIAYERQDVWNNYYINRIDTFDSYNAIAVNAASPIGFDIYFSADDYAFLLNGMTYREVLPAKKQVVHSSPEETVESFSSPEDIISFSLSPFHLLQKTDWEFSRDTVLNSRQARIFNTIVEDELDDNRLRQITDELILDTENGQILLHNSTTIIDEELLQKISTYYSDYDFEPNPIASRLNIPDNYSQISQTDYLAAQEAERLEVGIVAPDFSISNSQGQVTSLQQFRGQRVLLNFSFLGCGGCEAAMKDFNATDFSWPADLHPIYLSYKNTAEEISTYYENKGMPFATVLPEAEVIRAAYGVYFSPTFFLIDGEGVIEGIVEGYDEGFIAGLSGF